jgi:hypothetical protein
VSDGWRGAGHEAGLYLSPDDDERVCAAHARAVEAGGALDAKLKDLEGATSGYGGQLEGLEYSVKGLDSLRRKVAADVVKGEDVADLVAGTRDMNRYTVCFPAESYSEGVAASFDHLQEYGLEPYDPSRTHKNTWNDPAYKGINTSWVDRDTGQFVEVQFHTPESFQAKSDNHALYELSRSGSLDDDEMAAADRLQAERYEGVEIPEGHDSTVPARPARELNDFPPEALEHVRAKEAELKQSRASESPAVEDPESDPPRSADANDVTQAESVQDARDDVGEGPDTAEAGDAEKGDAEPPEAATAAEDQGVQDAADERPGTGESEDSFPQPVDEGVAEPREADIAAEEQSPGESADAQEADRSPHAEDAQGAGGSYDDHEDEQMARISAADEQRESGDRDDYGDTSFATKNRERGGVGD